MIKRRKFLRWIGSFLGIAAVNNGYAFELENNTITAIQKEYSGFPKCQKFPMGSFVKIKKITEPEMSHFQSDIFARVKATYKYQFGGGDYENTQYTLIIQHDKGNKGGWGQCSWYKENQLELVTDKKTVKKLEKDFNNCEEASMND